MPLPSVRTLVALALALSVGCGSAAPARAPSARRARTAALAPNRLYRIDHDVEERLEGRLVRVRRTRVFVWVGAARPDGTLDATASLTRQDEGSETRSRALVALQLSPEGRLLRDPDLLCDESDDDLFAARFLRHVVAPYPRGEGGELFVEQREEPLAPRLSRAGAQLRAEAELRFDDEPLALGHASGAMRVRAHADVDARDPLAFDVRTRIDGSPTLRTESAGRRAQAVRIDERTVSARIESTLRPPTTCDDLDHGEFDVRVIIRAIQRHQAAIRTCYETQLRDEPTLRGRIKMAISVDVDGRIYDVTTVENGFPEPRGTAIASCVGEALASMGPLAPPPIGAAVRYQFPFVFEPQDDEDQSGSSQRR